jgi:FkbM family methyltransferase
LIHLNGKGILKTEEVNDRISLKESRSELVSGLTRRLVEWPGGYRASQFLINRFGEKTRPVRAEVFGFDMVLDARDHACRKLLYYPNLYESEERAVLIPLIRQADTVVDVGAHVGVYSLLASRRAAKVLSIEADPSTFQYLERNLALNVAHNVTAVLAGVSDHRESLRLFRDKNLQDRSGHSFVPGWGREESIPVECLPLSEILMNHAFNGCDVLKIDVEGFEFRVLKPFLEECRPRLILTEYFESRNTGDVCALLKSNGYRLDRQIGRDYFFIRNENQK